MNSTKHYSVPPESLTGRLIGQCASWQDYTCHPFVEQLAQGTLPERCFQHYLIQDYLFLIHFSRAWALAAFKADSIADIRACTATVHALINEEIRLHVDYCASFGIDEAEMAATPEHPANLAYTRYVMERGISGDLLDLLVALAPCVAGYGEIGARLGMQTGQHGNRYQAWIDMYASCGYQETVMAASAQLDRLAASRLGNRMPELQNVFDQATRLEIGFWQMALTPGM